MERMTCYDAAEMVLDEATQRFAPLFRENRENKLILRQYCDALDLLAEEFDGVSFEIDVDEITMEITLTMECGEIELSSAKHRLFQLAALSKKFSIRHGEGDTLALAFTFSPIWERAS